MYIRKAKTDDLPALLQLNLVCYPEDSLDPTVPARLAAVLRKGHSWVVDQEGEIVACLLSRIENGLPYIWSVCCTPVRRGRGHAASLIKEFESDWKRQGFRNAWLQCRVTNPAQKLYFSLGYRVSKFQQDIYGVNEHGIDMHHAF